jgi:hypothetical protein
VFLAGDVEILRRDDLSSLDGQQGGHAGIGCDAGVGAEGEDGEGEQVRGLR